MGGIFFDIRQQMTRNVVTQLLLPPLPITSSSSFPQFNEESVPQITTTASTTTNIITSHQTQSEV